MKDSNKKDTRYLSFLSVVACLAVVFLHTNGCFWNFSATGRYWLTANIIESVFYFAVPVFFMISGATLIDYSDRYSTTVFFKKRILKTVIPFVVWSLLAIPFAVFVLKTVKPESIHAIYAMNTVFNASLVGYYWFFPSLIGAYLSMPLLSAIDKAKKKSAFTYVAVAGFLLNGLIPFVKDWVLPRMSFPFTVIVVGYPIIYLVIGYLLAHYDCSKKWKCAVYIAAAAALMAHILGTYTLSMEAGTVVKKFKHLVVAVPYACGVFLLFKTYGNRILDRWKWLAVFVDWFKKYTFAIYLLHWFGIKILNHLHPFDTKSLVYRLGAPFVIVPACIGVTMLLRKIPVIRRLLPD